MLSLLTNTGKMTKKEAYKKMIGSFGTVTLAYLISYYEDLDEPEFYQEC